MGRRRTQRACAAVPSMLSSAQGVPELHRAAADAEVSAAAAAPTGSESPRSRDGSGPDRRGRSPSATTSSTGAVEGAERLGDSPARKPDPEPGRMDHHQPGTGRYQVVSVWPPPRPSALPKPRSASRCGLEHPSRVFSEGDALANFCFCVFWPTCFHYTSSGRLPLTPSLPTRLLRAPTPRTLYPAVRPPF